MKAKEILRKTTKKHRCNGLIGVGSLLEKSIIKAMEEYAKASAVEAIVSLPEGVTDIRLRQWEQQENPFNGTEQKLKWLCELSDTCVFEGDWDMRVTGDGDTQREAFNEALQKWEEAN